jgi:pimeloyl-ACP methyl ester carboxylesterase
MLHGYQDCSDTWQFLVDCLPDAWTLVAPDWRGFGGTEWAPGGYWFPDYLADLEVLLDHLVPNGPARVISHSMGANVAGLYGGVRPKRLQWLVNLEGVGLRRNPPDAAPGHYASWLDELKEPLSEGRYDSVQQLADVLVKRNPRLTAERAQFVARAWTRDVTDAAGTEDAVGAGEAAGAGNTGGEGGAVRLAFDPKHRLSNPVLYRRDEAEACWARFEIPMLLIAGDQSHYQKRRSSEFSDEYVHRVFRGSQIVTLAGVGHMMHHEDPQGVAAAIIDFARAHS